MYWIHIILQSTELNTVLGIDKSGHICKMSPRMVRTFDLVSSEANIQYFRGILKICAQIAETQVSVGIKEQDTEEGENEVDSIIVGVKQTSAIMTIYLQEKEKAPKVNCEVDFQVSHTSVPFQHSW